MKSLSFLQTYYTNKINPQDFDLLLSRAIDHPKEFVLTYPNFKPNIFQRLRLAYFLFLYKRGYSVVAITKHKEFFGLDFYVNKHVLIPRPETELLVEEAIEEIKKSSHAYRQAGNQKINLIDVGTGSGCIPIAINKTKNQKTCPEPSRGIKKTIAIDISKKALRLAKKNARRHNVKIDFFHGNLFDPIIHNSKFIIHNSNVIITANLPYLTQTQFDNEPTIQREPKFALVADAHDGLSLYDQLLLQIKQLTTDYGLQTTVANGQAVVRSLSTVVLLEINPTQTDNITRLIKKHLPLASVVVKKDLAGLDRLIKIVVGAGAERRPLFSSPFKPRLRENTR